MSKPVEIEEAKFEEAVLKATSPVLVDFWGPRCSPCLALMPRVEALEEEYEGKLKVTKLNAGENRMLCAKLRVMGLPTILLYKDGQEINRLSGESLTIEEIKGAVKKIL